MGQPRTEWTGPFPMDILKKLIPSTLKYVDWYCNNGKYLPEAFASDPSTYTQRMRTIEHALKAIKEGRTPVDDADKKLIDEGTSYFFEHFKDLYK